MFKGDVKVTKSFHEYVKNRIVENTDYNKISDVVNELILEKGYITPEDLQEGLMRNIGGVFSGLGKMGSSALDTTNDFLDATGDKIKSGIKSGAQFAGNSFKNVGKGIAQGAVQGALNTGKGLKSAYGAVNNTLEKAKNSREVALVSSLQKELNNDSAFKQLPPPNQMILNSILNKMKAMA